MIDKEIKIPRGLQELHGERSRLSTLIMVYLAALLIAGITLWRLVPLGLPWWKLLLAGLLFLDIGGGVAANFSESTRRYYRERPNLRIPFILTHVVHPLLFALIFQGASGYAAFALFFTLAAMFFLSFVKDVEMQQILAALLTGAGICLSFLFPLPATMLYVFAPLFMVKLILGFSVKSELAAE